MSKTIHGYKGFGHDMKCRNFQYVEGKEYSHEGDAVACESGFHFCENPLDVFSYYEPGESVFHAVEGSGKISRHDDDSKVACTKIKIGLKLSLHDLIGASIKFLFSREYEESTSSHAEDDCSASSATGFGSKAMAGKHGCIALAWWNDTEERAEMRCAETGCGDGSDGKLKADVWYWLNKNGEFEEIR